MNAIQKLHAAQQRTGSLLSIGLEPAPEYLPAGFAPNMEGYEEFLRTIIIATEGLACAYKFNLAFFESLGWEGMELLYVVREMIPDDVLLIADAKRGDIGSTAKHYARALYDQLGADAVTLNPLMGRDSAEPFLERTEKLNFFLVLTSNPGAADFLLPEDFYLKVGAKVAEWNTAGNCGFVAGATRPEYLAKLRALGPQVPFLVPGIGAQGGDIEATLQHGGDSRAFPSLLLHVTRGILPTPQDGDDIEEAIRRRTQQWQQRVTQARQGGTA